MDSVLRSVQMFSINIFCPFFIFSVFLILLPYSTHRIIVIILHCCTTFHVVWVAVGNIGPKEKAV